MADYDGGAEAAARQVARPPAAISTPNLREFAANIETILARSRPPTCSPPRWRRAAARDHGPGETSIALCSAFATFADLKGRFLLGHSAHVAELAERAGKLLGYDEDAARTLRAARCCSTSVASASRARSGTGRAGSARWSGSGCGCTPTGPSGSSGAARRSSGSRRSQRRITSGSTAAATTAAHGGSSSRAGAAARRRRHVRGADRGAPAPRALARGRGRRAARGGAGGAARRRRPSGAVVEAAGLPRSATRGRTSSPTARSRCCGCSRGLSNREIAETLVLSPRTVQHHLASVYDKINLRTRAGAAVFAIEHGLVPAAPDI